MVDVLVDEAGAVKLPEDGHYAACAVNVLHVVLDGRGSDLADMGNDAGEAVDVLHGEVNACLLGYGEKVKDGVGRSAHGDVERHGVLEGGLGGD